jgi:predicted XRE-type DNA-binding protein
MTSKIPEHEVGSGNVFADIARPDAETHLLKAELVSRLQDIIAERKLSQVKAAAILGIAQPDLSNILHGRFRGTSVERLMRFLTALGCEVDIVLRRGGTSAREDRIHLQPAVA